LVNKTTCQRNIALASLLALAACAQPAATVRVVAGDGEYTGTATRSQYPQRRDCPHSGPFHLTVQSGVTYFRWSYQYIPVQVLSNGTLTGTLPGVQLTGTHDGSTMRGDVTDGQCWLHFTLKRRDS
jgi:hypothetical protein